MLKKEGKSSETAQKSKPGPKKKTKAKFLEKEIQSFVFHGNRILRY